MLNGSSQNARPSISPTGVIAPSARRTISISLIHRDRIPWTDRLAFPVRRAAAEFDQARGAAREGWSAIGRQPLRQIALRRGAARVGGEVGPLVRVGALVVELFGAVRVADVAPSVAAHGVVAGPVGGDRRPGPRRGGIFQL